VLDEIEKSLNKDSQIRDLPNTSVVKQRRRSKTKDSAPGQGITTEKTEFGNWMYEASDLRKLSDEGFGLIET
jgi:hypothetical protein